jgi:hypothetical protein
MLLHAGATSRHNLIMFEKVAAQFSADAAVAASLICHVDTDAAGNAQSLPGKDGNNPQKPCPICLGLASAHALQTGEAPLLRVPDPVYLKASVAQEAERTPAARFSLPHTRAPPSLV